MKRLIFAVLVLATTACGSHQTNTEPEISGSPAPIHDHTRPTDQELKASRAVSNQAALAAHASHFVEIAFAPGSSQLTDESRAAIRDVLTTAAKSGQVAEVKVLAWADEEFPAIKQKRLATPQKRLADRRSQSVSSYIKTLKYDVDVDRYNMAERSNALQSWLQTSDAKIKNALLAAGLPTTADEIQYPSKASKSVILVRLVE